MPVGGLARPCPITTGVHDPLFQPAVLAVENSQSELVVRAVVVGPELMEEALDAASSLPAEEVGEVLNLPSTVSRLADNGSGVHHGGREREELGSDVDQTREISLLVLQAPLPPSQDRKSTRLNSSHLG